MHIMLALEGERSVITADQTLSVRAGQPIERDPFRNSRGHAHRQEQALLQQYPGLVEEAMARQLEQGPTYFALDDLNRNFF